MDSYVSEIQATLHHQWFGHRRLKINYPHHRGPQAYLRIVFGRDQLILCSYELWSSKQKLHQDIKSVYQDKK